MRCACLIAFGWCLGFVIFTVAPSIVGLHCLAKATWCTEEGAIYGTILLFFALMFGGIFTVWCVWRHFRLKSQREVKMTPEEENDIGLGDDEIEQEELVKIVNS